MHKIRGQLKLSEKDFKDLVAFPLKYEGYLDILERRKFNKSRRESMKGANFLRATRLEGLSKRTVLENMTKWG